jgi:hypothetical protein
MTDSLPAQAAGSDTGHDCPQTLHVRRRASSGGEKDEMGGSCASYAKAKGIVLLDWYISHIRTSCVNWGVCRRAPLLRMAQTGRNQ